MLDGSRRATKLALHFGPSRAGKQLVDTLIRPEGVRSSRRPPCRNSQLRRTRPNGGSARLHGTRCERRAPTRILSLVPATKRRERVPRTAGPCARRQPVRRPLALCSASPKLCCSREPQRGPGVTEPDSIASE